MLRSRQRGHRGGLGWNSAARSLDRAGLQGRIDRAGLTAADMYALLPQQGVNDPGHIVNSDDSRPSFVCGAQPDSAKIGGARRGLAMAASGSTSSRRSGSARQWRMPSVTGPWRVERHH